MGIIRRLIYWVRARRAEAELAEELETHRAMMQARLERDGVPAREAAYASRRAMGNVTLAREHAREVWIWPWLDGVRQDVSYAVRIMRRAPAFAASIVLVLSLGLGATTGVFSLVDGLMLRSLPVHEPDRLVWFRSPSFSYPAFQLVSIRSAGLFDGFFGWDMERFNVEWSQEPEPTEVLLASGSFYSTLGVRAAIGRTLTPDDDRIGGGRDGLVAVVSHATWQRRFGGDSSVIGRTIRVERQPFTIVGVAPADFFGVAPGLAPELTIPLTSLEKAENLRSPFSSMVHMMGRLRDTVSIDEADAAVQSFWPSVLEAVTRDQDLAPDRRAVYLGRRTGLEPGRAGFSRVRNQFGQPLWMLLGLVALLMTVACASAANLLFARGVARRREIAVRLAIGASRPRVMRQMLTEALVWTVAAAGAGLLIATWGAAGLVALMATRAEPIVLDIAPNWRLSAFMLALMLFTASVCALVPALRATRLPSAAVLRDPGFGGGLLLRRWSFGKSLVAAQVALAVVLLVGAGLFLRSLERILSQETGFDRRDVLVIATDPIAVGYSPPALANFYDTLLARLRALPSVEAAGLSSYPPISDEDGAWTQSVSVDGAPVTSDSRRAVFFNAVSPEYFRTLGMHFALGRDFDRRDTASSPRVVIVNESLARRFFPGESPLGRRISVGRNQSRRDLEIVGVVSDSKYRRLEEQPGSIAYVPCAQHAELLEGENLFAEVRTRGSSGGIAEAVRQEVRGIDPRVPVRIETIADRIRESLVKERVLAILSAGLGVVAVTIACAGLYGLLGYAVTRQSSEIGLRLALGANRRMVIWLVLRDCLILAAVGITAGLGASLAFGRVARNLLFQVSTSDPVTLIAVAVLMTGVAVLAGLLPARRAARIDPTIALRAE